MTKRMGKYELGRILGTGNFSKVRVGTDTQTNEVFAIKIIDKALLAKERLEEQLKREIAVLKVLKHRHIVGMREVLQTSRHIYIVLELVEGGELFERIATEKRFSEDKARKYFQQLVLAVRYCHTQNIAHRDLKPENLLLDGSGDIKISDFGLANLVHTNDDLMSTVCGTPNYVAPEVIKDRGYNGFAADVWSCGIILYVMLSGHQAFDDDNVKALFNKIERGEYRMSRYFSDSAKDLISKILVVDASRRYTINQIIAHPWFQVGFDPADLTATDNVIEVDDKAKNGAFDAIDDPRSPTEESLKTTNGEDGFAIAQRLMSATLMPWSKGVRPQGDAGPGPLAPTHRALMYRGTMDNAMKDLQSALKTMSPTISVIKGEGFSQEVKGFANAKRGLVTYTVEVTPLASGNVVLFEVKKGRGDAFDFGDMVKQLHIALGKDKLASEPIDA